uniref:Transmembrane protein 65 n=1 Tax=Oncorhynchus kisutch TaxID=8019 RepID=A0A8C7MWS4_ONCKI
MFKLCLQIALRPTIPTRAVLESVTVRKVLKVSHLQSCWMGTLGRNEPREPLNSPKRAKEFIYSLHPKERKCLLKELQSFESIAIAQAAALGNLVSDLAGLGLAGYVEVLASRLGMQVPDLTPKQADMWQTRVSSHMGKGIGVTIGCILGMFPLLFLGDDEDESKKKEAHTNTTDS